MERVRRPSSGRYLRLWLRSSSRCSGRGSWTRIAVNIDILIELCRKTQRSSSSVVSSGSSRDLGAGSRPPRTPSSCFAHIPATPGSVPTITTARPGDDAFFCSVPRTRRRSPPLLPSQSVFPSIIFATLYFSCYLSVSSSVAQPSDASSSFFSGFWSKRVRVSCRRRERSHRPRLLDSLHGEVLFSGGRRTVQDIVIGGIDGAHTPASSRALSFARMLPIIRQYKCLLICSSCAPIHLRHADGLTEHRLHEIQAVGAEPLDEETSEAIPRDIGEHNLPVEPLLFIEAHDEDEAEKIPERLIEESRVIVLRDGRASVHYAHSPRRASSRRRAPRRL